jgi:hypothetical protein
VAPAGNDGPDHFEPGVGRFFAGPWSFARGATSNDETLHLVALNPARRRTLRGSRGTEVPVQADGDTVAALPTTICIHDGVIFYA